MGVTGSAAAFFSTHAIRRLLKGKHMAMPLIWERASFSVCEVVALIGVSETQLRTWLARAPFIEYLGLRDEKRIRFGGHDAFFYLLVREFTTFGVPVREAMHMAKDFADRCADGIPCEYLLLDRSGEKTTVRSVETFNLTEAVEGARSGSLAVLPVRQMASDLLDRGMITYMRGRPQAYAA